MKKVRKRVILIIVIIVAAIFAVVRIRSFMRVPLESEAAETRLRLEVLEARDIAAVQEEIDNTRRTMTVDEDVSDDEYQYDPDGTGEDRDEDQEYATAPKGDVTDIAISDIPSSDELKKYDFKEIFSGCVVIGNSFAEGLEGYGFLNSSEVSAKNGASIFNSDDLLEKAAGLSPKTVFLVFGLNDMDAYGKNIETFKEDYAELLDKVAGMMPNASCCSMLILPLKESAYAEHASYKYLDQFNQAIAECCLERETAYMDLTSTFTDEYYAPDGIHPNVDYYYIWSYCMAKGMGLL